MSQADLASKNPDVMKIVDMTKQTREVFMALLSEKLKYWIEAGHCRIEALECDVDVKQDRTLNGGLIKDIIEVTTAFDLSFYVTCEMMTMVVKIY